MNNPYKRIGGGSLDQALFKKGQQKPVTAAPTPPTSEEPSFSTTRSTDNPELPKTTNRQALHTEGVRPNAPSSVRPNGKRIITRNSFEIYEDQMDALRKLSFQEKMDGKLGSMSCMVREAIDEYSLKEILLNTRTPVRSFSRSSERCIVRLFVRSSDATAHRTGLFKLLILCLYCFMALHNINPYRNGSLSDKLINWQPALYKNIVLYELIKSTR